MKQVVSSISLQHQDPQHNQNSRDSGPCFPALCRARSAFRRFQCSQSRGERARLLMAALRTHACTHANAYNRSCLGSRWMCLVCACGYEEVCVHVDIQVSVCCGPWQRRVSAPSACQVPCCTCGREGIWLLHTQATPHQHTHAHMHTEMPWASKGHTPLRFLEMPSALNL